MSTFGERVTAARERVKLRQTELAERVGVTPGAINKIESGESKGAKPMTLAALARALGVSMEWLATGKEGFVLEPQGDYAAEQASRLLVAWEGLPLNLRVPLLRLIEAMAGVDEPVVIEATEGYQVRNG